MARIEHSNPPQSSASTLSRSRVNDDERRKRSEFLPRALFVGLMIGALLSANRVAALDLSDGSSLKLADVARKLNLSGRGWITSLSWLTGLAATGVFLLFPLTERFIRTFASSLLCLVTMILPYYVMTRDSSIDPDADGLGSGLTWMWVFVGLAAVVPWASLLWWNREDPVFGRFWLMWLFLLPAVIWILVMTIFPLVYAFTTSRYGFRNGRINRFVGWDNYRRLWEVESWNDTIQRTVVASVIAAGVVILVGLVLGFISNHEVGRSTLRSALGFVPVVAVPVVLVDFLTHTLKDPLDTQLGYTVSFVAASVSIEMFFGFLLALLMNRELRGRAVLRAVITLPVFAAPVGIGFLFRTILYEGGGPVNTWLDRIGIGAKPWLSNPEWSRYSTVLADAWLWIPFVFVIALAGLQNLPQDVIEAAEVDGASAWQVFRYMTLPLMAPILWLILLLRTIDAFKVFDIPASLTLGGPGRATEYWSLFNYRTARKNLNYGDAAVQAFLLLAIVAIVVGLLWNKIQHVYEEEGLKG